MLYITPSRGRPGNIVELIKSWEETRSPGNDDGEFYVSRLWVAVDDDDPQLGAYQAIEYPTWARLIVVPRKRLGPTLNDLAREAVSTFGHRAIGFMGDDHRPRTPGWDALLLQAIHTHGTGVYYGNDLVQGAALPTAVLITGDIVEALGYFCPPGMIHLYLDNAWKHMGQAVSGLRYLSHVVIEHVHPITQKVEWDDTYREVNSGEMYASDGAKFKEWVGSGSAGWRAILGAMGDRRG